VRLIGQKMRGPQAEQPGKIREPLNFLLNVERGSSSAVAKPSGFATADGLPRSTANFLSIPGWTV
jgi:hypothetical protein